MNKLKNIARLLLCATLFFPSLTCHADGYSTGNDLQTWFNSALRVSTGNRNELDSYQAGRLTGFVEAAAAFTTSAAAICLPDNVTNGQLEDMLKKYVNEHPEKLHLPAYGITLMAWSTFKCKK